MTKRLGWVPDNATYEKAHQILDELIPPDRYYPLRINSRLCRRFDVLVDVKEILRIVFRLDPRKPRIIIAV